MSVSGLQDTLTAGEVLMLADGFYFSFVRLDISVEEAFWMKRPGVFMLESTMLVVSPPINHSRRRKWLHAQLLMLLAGAESKTLPNSIFPIIVSI